MAVFITLLVIVVIAAIAFTAYRWPQRVGLGPRLQLQPLNEGDEAFYTDSWNHIQGGFVDHPKVSLDSADKLVTQLLAARGYPVSDSEALTTQLSHRHGTELPAYQKARDLLHTSGEVSTEDARQALMDMRNFSEALLADAGATLPARAAAGGRAATSASATEPPSVTR